MINNYSSWPREPPWFVVVDGIANPHLGDTTISGSSIDAHGPIMKAQLMLRIICLRSVFGNSFQSYRNYSTMWQRYRDGPVGLTSRKPNWCNSTYAQTFQRASSTPQCNVFNPTALNRLPACYAAWRKGRNHVRLHVRNQERLQAQ